MSQTHTPGPWKFTRITYSSFPAFHLETVDQSHKKTFIGEVGGGLQSAEEIKANAFLIAAAPELLESLEWLVSKVGELEGELSLIAMGKCLDAIAKAKGGQP